MMVVGTGQAEKTGKIDRQAAPFYRRYVQAAQNTGNRFWNWLNHITNGFAAYLAQAFTNFVTKGTGEAVIFGYWSVFSLFPMVMLAVVIVSLILGPQQGETIVFNVLNRFIPGGGTDLIRENIVKSFSEQGSFGLVGIVGLVYGAAGLFAGLQNNLSRIFRDKQPRSFPAQLIIGLGMLVVLTVLIFISVIASLLFNLVGMQVVGAQSPLLGVGAAVLPLAINTLMFYLLFRYIPQRNITWKALWPASLFAGIAWELSKNLFGWYVSHLANYGVVYGSLGTVIALLTWTYLMGCFVSLCGEIAVATDDWLAKRPPAVAVTNLEPNKPVQELKPDQAEHAVIKPEQIKKPMDD